MHCNCGRTHFEPADWVSEDGKSRFRRDQHGFTDITPGPNAGILEWLKDHGYVLPTSKVAEKSNHIHW